MVNNPAQVDEALANASIEQITEMALKKQGGEAAGASTDQPGAAAAKGELDVSASSGQTEEQNAAEAARKEAEAKAKGTETDKEMNFAKMRTKLEAQEREVQRLAEENRRLAESRYVAELPADHAQKMAEVDARLSDIGSKFQEGELTFDQYQEEIRKANAEREQLLAASIKSQISKEMSEQREKEAAARAAAEKQATEKQWEETVDQFIGAKPDGVDYGTDHEKRGSLNTYVKALATDPDNDGKPFDWFLQEAHALVKAKHGVAAAAKPAAPNQDDPAKPGAPIHTLSDLPGGLTPAKSDVEQLDQMSGAALTNRFANMSPEQIDAELAKFGT